MKGMTATRATALVAAWCLFGWATAGAADSDATDADAAVREAVDRAVKDAAERIAREAADAKAAEAKADKLRAEAKEDAKEAREERDRELSRIATRVFKLEHVSAQDVADKFNEMWNGEFGQTWKVTKMAVAFPESNSIMVTAPRQILDTCAKMVGELDVEARQVYIEARFVELSNNASHKLGIDWQMLDGMTGSMKLGGGVKHSRLGKGVTDYRREESDGLAKTTYGLSGGVGANGDISYFNGTLDFSQMYLTLRALESTKDARIFSNPKIIVSSGKKATVDMTTKYPNVKISAKRTQNGNSDSLDLDMAMAAIPGEDKMMFAKESFFSWGISLEVTPRVGTNGLINVSIVPTISSQSDWVTAGTASDDAEDTTVSAKYPVIDMQRLITEFNMASGTTAVIGGLSRTEETQVDNGIPWLRDWPWIGPLLFGSKVRVKEQKEILVFVTVGLVDPHEMKKDAGLPKNAVLGRQYAKGQKLEPGDKPEKNLEGVESLDMRPLEEQAKDPLNVAPRSGDQFRIIDYIPFTKDQKHKKAQ